MGRWQKTAEGQPGLAFVIQIREDFGELELFDENIAHVQVESGAVVIKVRAQL